LFAKKIINFSAFHPFFYTAD